MDISAFSTHWIFWNPYPWTQLLFFGDRVSLYSSGCSPHYTDQIGLKPTEIYLSVSWVLAIKVYTITPGTATLLLRIFYLLFFFFWDRDFMWPRVVLMTQDGFTIAKKQNRKHRSYFRGTRYISMTKQYQILDCSFYFKDGLKQVILPTTLLPWECWDYRCFHLTQPKSFLKKC